MSNMVTRCPKCATSFRITSAQLQSAKGAVRCGSCLHIFKAQDHLVASTTPVAAATTPPDPSTPSTETAPQGKQSRSAPVDEKPAVTVAPLAAPLVAPPVAQPSAKTSSNTVAKPKVTASPRTETPVQAVTQSSTVADKPTTPVTPATGTFVFSQQQIDDELAALGDDDDILISDDMHHANKKTPSDQDFSSGHGSDYSSDYSSDAFLEIDDRAKPSVSLFERKAREEQAAEEDGADESWAENLLDESDEETRIDEIKHRIDITEDDDVAALAESFNSSFEQADAAHHESTTYSGQMFSLINDDTTEDHDFKEIFSEEELSEELRATSPAPQNAVPEAAPAPTSRGYDTSRAALLMNIMPEPVVMTKRNKRKWQRKKLWLRLSILMIVVLLIQVAWLQFDTLSRINPYRSGYELICPMLGCQVPTLVDRSKIRVRNLLVRKHPDLAGALIVDVIVLNNAAHPQPFPDLVMAFSDIDEIPVAARRFTPREYLRGELAGYNLMPQNQPVHISLELVDPGEEAVNYKIEPY
jgi:predicted Zn finger-like uncharacterized protein